MSARNKKRPNKKWPGKKVEDGAANSTQKQDDGGEKSPQLSSLNDISWYSRYPELLASAASIPYPLKPGMPFTQGKVAMYSGDNLTLTSFTNTLPGVLAIHWFPSLPNTGTATDAANIAAREIYARVRKAYSGRLYADAPDFLIYILALDSVYAYIAWLHRIYRTICSYTPENLYAPDTLLRAYGLTESTILDLKQNQMQFYQNIIELVQMTTKFNCPDEFDLMRRHYWMSKNVYADAEGVNTQLYTFSLDAVFKFELLNTPDSVLAGGLTLTRLPFNSTVDEMFTFGRNLIDALSAWEDSYTISGYLARAFEGSSFFRVELPTLNEILTFEYQPEVLSQIENSYTDTGNMSIAISSRKLQITQDPKTNCILWQPTVSTDRLATLKTYRLDAITKLINIHKMGHPSIEDTVIATRLRTQLDTRKISDVVPIPDGGLSVITGTEWVTNYVMFPAQPGSPSVGRTFTSVDVYNFKESGLLTEGFNRLIVDLTLPNFDWAPARYITLYGNDGSFLGVFNVWDVFNATRLSSDDLENIHRICTYSEFNAFSV